MNTVGHLTETNKSKDPKYSMKQKINSSTNLAVKQQTTLNGRISDNGHTVIWLVKPDDLQCKSLDRNGLKVYKHEKILT